jgi:hypothetical protein
MTIGGGVAGGMTAGVGAGAGITPPAERPNMSHPTTKRITSTPPPISIQLGPPGLAAGGIIYNYEII